MNFGRSNKKEIVDYIREHYNNIVLINFYGDWPDTNVHIICDDIDLVVKRKVFVVMCRDIVNNIRKEKLKRVIEKGN